MIPGDAVDNGLMTITEFLEARIAEDEAEAKLVEAEGDNGSSPVQHPARVLAECAAKRTIIEEHELGERSDGTRRSVGCVLCNYNRDYGWDETGPCKTLRAIAAIYKDHPDYRQEWD